MNGRSAKYWVQSIAAVDKRVHRPVAAPAHGGSACTWAATASVANSMNCAYMRASCEYHTQNGANDAERRRDPAGAAVVDHLAAQYERRYEQRRRRSATAAGPANSGRAEHAHRHPQQRSGTAGARRWCCMSRNIWSNGICAWCTLIASSTQRPRSIAVRSTAATAIRPSIASVAVDGHRQRAASARASPARADDAREGEHGGERHRY